MRLLDLTATTAGGSGETQITIHMPEVDTTSTMRVIFTANTPADPTGNRKSRVAYYSVRGAQKGGFSVKLFAAEESVAGNGGAWESTIKDTDKFLKILLNSDSDTVSWGIQVRISMVQE